MFPLSALAPSFSVLGSRRSSHAVGSSRKRRGFTLIEILVALTAALVLLSAVVSVLGMVGGNVANSRSMIEASNRLRSAQLLLRSDLMGHTCNGMVWQRPEDNAGFIEIVEGSTTDSTNISSIVGDWDDMLFMTVRAKDKPFTATYYSAGNPYQIQSNLAEVVWFMVPSTKYHGTEQTYNLCRRIFLIMPNTDYVKNTILTGASNNTHDVAFRTVGGVNVPCTLGDLSNRKNRVFHDSSATAFPHNILAIYTSATHADPNNMRFQPTATPNREGEDIVLIYVVVFDIKVFDPQAKIDSSGRLPGEPSYAAGGSQTGAYVDLGTAGGGGGSFNKAMETKSKLSTAGAPPTFDTWTFEYEQDGIDQDGQHDADSAINGLDDDSTNGIDDAGERDTSPPYPYPLRGIQIRIRVYEPSSHTIREVSVKETFLPE